MHNQWGCPHTGKKFTLGFSPSMHSFIFLCLGILVKQLLSYIFFDGCTGLSSEQLTYTVHVYYVSIGEEKLKHVELDIPFNPVGMKFLYKNLFTG